MVGFTAAARRLNVSTDAVSENVQVLENALGVRLLNRITQRVEGVAAGVSEAICTFSPFSSFTGG
jgi:DNA-binding transcriptional LysR family regulator